MSEDIVETKEKNDREQMQTKSHQSTHTRLPCLAILTDLIYFVRHACLLV